MNLLAALLLLSPLPAKADVNVPRPADSLDVLDQTAFRIAERIAEIEGEQVDSRCLGYELKKKWEHWASDVSHTAKRGRHLRIYNIAFGRFNVDIKECPDPHHSLWIVLDESGKEVATYIDNT